MIASLCAPFPRLIFGLSTLIVLEIPKEGIKT
jgi:hypothetical protein